MQAGRLNNRVTLQKKVLTGRDELGGEKFDWPPIAEVWADVRYVSGREYTKNGLDSSSATVSVKVRRNSLSEQVDTNCRILFHNRILDITAVLPDEQNRESITFVCTDGLNRG